MSDWYVLDENHNPVKVDIMTAAESMGSERIVSKTILGEARVSTVFLGLDHSWGEGPPILFETMIFGGPEDGFQERYSTWEDAVSGHERAVSMLSDLPVTKEDA